MASNDRLSVPRYIVEQADYVADLSGRQILLEEDPGEELYVQVSFSDARAHKLIFPPAYRPHIPHLLLIAAHRIQRLWEAPPSERLVPTYNVKDLGSDDDEYCRRLARPERSADEFSENQKPTIVDQVTCLPVGIRMEWEIAQTYPQHRSRQVRYLYHQLGEREARFAPDLADRFPEQIHAAGCAMNIATIEETVDILGAKIHSAWHETGYCELADRLREKLTTPTPGHLGDREVTDAWAEELGLRDWYEWVAPTE